MAIVSTTVVAMLLTLVGDLSTLAETVVLLLLFVFISTNVAVLVLRRDTVEHRALSSVDGMPVLGVASCLLLLTQQTAKVWLFAAILLAVGVALFIFRHEWRRGARITLIPALGDRGDCGGALVHGHDEMIEFGTER